MKRYDESEIGFFASRRHRLTVPFLFPTPPDSKLYEPTKLSNSNSSSHPFPISPTWFIIFGDIK